jgi:molybdopterin/thiamine biosynthesis adenylyltransferase
VSLDGPAPSDRFARQGLVAGWRQEALGTATVVVCGVGALGNEVAKNLGLAGVGRLVLCDADTVDATNLSRTVLFRDRDVGRPKVEAAAQALAWLAPTTTVETRPSPLTSGVGLAELRDATVVAGCLDSRRARLELLGRCALADAVLVDGGTGPWSGEVRLRSGPDAACYACSLTARERAIADLPRAYTDLYPQEDVAASIALTALVGAWMATIALRVVLGATVRHEVLRIEALAGTTVPVELARDPECLHHQPLGPVDQRLPVGHEATVAELLAHLPPGSDAEVWSAFPATPACTTCGARAAYDLLKGDRERGRCMACGAGVRTVEGYRLSEADPSARLRDLGVAPREILPTRGPDGAPGLVELGGSG